MAETKRETAGSDNDTQLIEERDEVTLAETKRKVEILSNQIDELKEEIASKVCIACKGQAFVEVMIRILGQRIGQSQC